VNVFKGGAVNLDESFGVGAEVEADDDDDFGAATVAAASPTKKAGGMFSVFQGLVGNKPLERSALDPMMETLHSRLIEKNVASDIGGQICESVCSSLLGKQIGSFGSLRATVRDAMEKTLTRILTPSRRVDLLAACTAARAEKRPYTIVFVGVNGVGKSTSLSKVAYYLKSNGFTPMLCACDTFRAGAVEQLRVHAQSLDLPLFEKGYGRDASGIAADGIKYAAQMGYDVVMVDTAGRMQDNEPLMRSLSKLVTLNSPDLVLFVGEALVGNEAVDQVTGFNTALSEYSASKLPRIIDGIMLTKFDTIDDKVGAALSLVYTTGKPIVFVGVGQTYTDIRNLNVDHCVRALLKG
jgi:signal recognition particle receptor subunit alpha